MSCVQKFLSNSKRKSTEAKNLSRMPEKTQQSRINKTCAPVTRTTFKSAADFVTVIIGIYLFNYTLELLEVIITMQKSMFEIKCSDCGKTALISFKPTAGKPAYCKTCFSKHMFKRSESVSKTDSFDPKQAWARRREKRQGNTEAGNTNVFQWSYSIHDKAV